MKRITIGMLAHVDAGKTTLSEGLLYTGHAIRHLGRVDNQDTFLDTDDMERARGITIFSKQAILAAEEEVLTLLDTPGHVDFSAEMERTLAVLDYAVLVINGADGVQAHTRTLWKLLEQHNIPVFLFVNKMDQPGAVEGEMLLRLQSQLSANCVTFSKYQEVWGEKEPEAVFEAPDEEFFDTLAMCDEGCMEEFLEKGRVCDDIITAAVKKRHVFPCFFGSALRLWGVEKLLAALRRFTAMPRYPEEFGARVYKIARDEQDNRLTYLKVTGGTLRVRQNIGEDKVNQIRLCSGTKYETVTEAEAGTICAVTGLCGSYAGQGIGITAGTVRGVLEPVLNYRMVLPKDCAPSKLLLSLRELEEEEPQLNIAWNEELQELHVRLMGEVQTEILKNIIRERFGVTVGFDEGRVVYKETVAKAVEGIGHFEPLRHYAEVHVVIEPGAPGSGVTVASDCSEDILERSWQRLVMTHLAEREHVGVLTGSGLTDVKLTLVSGRAHKKHTEGGDFRQAAYRAVRQGLMKAESILLEPFYRFTLDIPSKMIGRAMTDIERMSGSCMPPQILGERAVLTGRGPVVTMRNYQKEVSAYCRGEGRLELMAEGYGPCHNPEEVIAVRGYDPEADVRNPAASVFCSEGTGFVVPWDEVEDYMHMEAVLREDGVRRRAQREDYYGYRSGQAEKTESGERYLQEQSIGTEEIDAILARTTHANSHDKSAVKRWGRKGQEPKQQEAVVRSWRREEKKEKYLLVDGYNIIFAWEELRAIAAVNADGARGRLLDILCDYQGIRGMSLIVVFDAYRVKRHDTEYLDYHNIHVVYTKEAETADRYIERFAHENGRKYDVTVATSDGLEQIIIRGQGCALLSARDFEKEVRTARENMAESYNARKKEGKNYLGEHMPEMERNGEDEIQKS